MLGIFFCDENFGLAVSLCWFVSLLLSFYFLVVGFVTWLALSFYFTAICARHLNVSCTSYYNSQKPPKPVDVFEQWLYLCMCPVLSTFATCLSLWAGSFNWFNRELFFFPSGLCNINQKKSTITGPQPSKLRDAIRVVFVNIFKNVRRKREVDEVHII